MADQRGSLRKRITLTIMMGISIILLTLGIASYYIISKNIKDSLNRKLALAHLIRNNVDNIIRDNISRLYDISLSGKIDLSDDDFGPEREAIKTAYRYSIFTDGIFLLDRHGSVMLNYPERIRDTALNIMAVEPVGRIIAQGRPVVTNIYSIEPSRKKVLFVMVPLKDKSGNNVGIVGGEIDPTNPYLTRQLGLIDMGKKNFIDIVDANGMVISSSDPSRTLSRYSRNNFFTDLISGKKELVTSCHQCHAANGTGEKKDFVLAFVPLEMAPWGISIQDPREAVFAPARRLKQTFATLACIFIGTAFILTVGISRSIVNPLNELIRCSDRIARGNLSQPISPQGSDEIGTLSRSFEVMRERLVVSMEHINRHTQELETRVEERTRQINAGQRRSEELLKKVISSQEDERKRIARELHDDTLQELSAALMRLDICRLHPEEISLEKIDTVRTMVVNAWDGVLGIVQNLRPSLLDDLGLAAAIKSLVDMHLGEHGVKYFINTSGVTDRRFRPEVETTLFRIVQEAVVNIARHARASNVFVLFKIAGNVVNVYIEDDGEGFDMNQLFMPVSRDARDRRGLGLQGMKERVFLIGGKIELCSMPGFGTRVDIRIPLNHAEVGHA